jgi:adenylate cyclase
MTTIASADISLFHDFRLDRRSGVLSQRDGRGVFVPLAIGGRALDLLTVLVEHPGDLVSRDEIMSAVWPGTVVEDTNLSVQISTLRRVLDNGRPERSLIQTVPGRGYRFVATVRRSEANPHLDDTAIVQRGARVPPRLSIVVLPIINFSSDPEQEYLADAITDDLTTDLSRIEGSFVISCNTAFTYKGRRVSANQIGAELGVRYVLEGSVQRQGSQVRINTQLIDAETDAHLWAERFERDAGDLFPLQDEITGRIAATLNLELVNAEATRPAEHPDAMDYLFRGRAAGFKPRSRDSYEERISLFERALALDPRSIEAQSYLATALAGRALDNMTDTAAADILRAEGLAERALAASPRSPLAHSAKGQVLRVQSRFEEAISEYEAVLASDRNQVNTYGRLSQCKFYTGAIERVIPLAEYAIRLSPRDPAIDLYYLRIGQVHLVQSRPDEAAVWLEKARNASPEHPAIRALLASAYGLKGKSERAAAELAEARRLSRDNRYLSTAHLRASRFYLPVPAIRDLYETTYYAGLRKAGMPEQ